MYFEPYYFVQISLACGANTFLRNVLRDFSLPMSALATAAGKSFIGKFTAKVEFSMGYLYVTIVDDVTCP